MASYRLSQTASEDFENIFDYGIDAFGFDQAIVYQIGMACGLMNWQRADALRVQNHPDCLAGI